MAFKPKVDVTQEVLDRINSGDKGLYELVYNDYVAYIKSLANKYSFDAQDYEDKFAIANVGFVKAIKSYDVTKEIRFLSFASVVMTNEILMYIRKNKKYEGKVTISLQEILTNSQNDTFELSEVIKCDAPLQDEVILDKELIGATRKAMDVILMGYPQKHRIMLKALLDGKLQHEAANEVGFSQSYASRVQRKFEGRVIARLKNMDLM